MYLTPFNPTGNTVNVDAATTASTGLLVGTATSTRLAGQSGQYLIHNAGSVTAWLAFGTDAATAEAAAVIPTGGGASAKAAIPAPPGSLFVITAPPGSFWSGITASSTAEVYITPGKGV